MPAGGHFAAAEKKEAGAFHRKERRRSGAGQGRNTAQPGQAVRANAQHNPQR